MNPQNQHTPEKGPPPQPPAQGKEVQVSLPNNEEIQTGPFPFSGETSRQTEEAREEEEEQKAS